MCVRVRVIPKEQKAEEEYSPSQISTTSAEMLTEDTHTVTSTYDGRSVEAKERGTKIKGFTSRNSGLGSKRRKRTCGCKRSRSVFPEKHEKETKK